MDRLGLDAGLSDTLDGGEELFATEPSEVQTDGEWLYRAARGEPIPVSDPLENFRLADGEKTGGAGSTSERLNCDERRLCVACVRAAISSSC
jgi:hypothetical protein